MRGRRRGVWGEGKRKKLKTKKKAKQGSYIDVMCIADQGLCEKHRGSGKKAAGV